MKSIRDMYRRRRDAFVEGTRKLGWQVPSPKAGLYIWFPVPKAGMPSMAFAEKALEAGVIMLPGSGFGQAAEGFMRVALTVSEDRIVEAVKRLGTIKL
jgi:LL-diaminopimelate aminotransferase